jgi:hypothetical protein
MRKFIAVLAAVIMTAGAMVAFQSAPAASAAKTKHEYDLTKWESGKVPGTSRFYVKGKFNTAGKKTIKLERKLPGKARKVYKKTKANKKGVFKFQFDGPVGTKFWAVAPQTPNYKKTSVYIGKIVRL